MIVMVVLAFSASLMALSSCAKKQVGQTEGTQPRQQVTSPPPSSSAPPARGQDMGGMDQKLQAEVKAFEAESIYFDFDKSDLKPAARSTLDKKAGWLRTNSGFKLRIEGNCDERGTAEYNLALGERRAKSAAKYLTALGISADRISTVSYGEEKPADPGHNEAAWSKNRRDEFKLAR